MFKTNFVVKLPPQEKPGSLLSRGNKKKNKNKNDPHLNFPRRGCRRVSNFCMAPKIKKQAGTCIGCEGIVDC